MEFAFAERIHAHPRTTGRFPTHEVIASQGRDIDWGPRRLEDDLGILTSLPCGWLSAWLRIMSMNLQGATNNDRTFIRREKSSEWLAAYLVITFARKALPAVDISPIVGEWTSPNWKRESITTAPKRPK